MSEERPTYEVHRDIPLAERWRYAEALLAAWPGAVRCYFTAEADGARCRRCNRHGIIWYPAAPSHYPCQIQDVWIPDPLASALHALGMRLIGATRPEGMVWRGLDAPMRHDEVRWQEGTIDEVVAHGVNVHLEYMDTNVVWIGITRGAEHMSLNLSSKKRIRLHVEDEGMGALVSGKPEEAS